MIEIVISATRRAGAIKLLSGRLTPRRVFLCSRLPVFVFLPLKLARRVLLRVAWLGCALARSVLGLARLILHLRYRDLWKRKHGRSRRCNQQEFHCVLHIKLLESQRDLSGLVPQRRWAGD